MNLLGGSHKQMINIGITVPWKLYNIIKDSNESTSVKFHEITSISRLNDAKIEVFVIDNEKRTTPGYVELIESVIRTVPVYLVDFDTPTIFNKIIHLDGNVPSISIDINFQQLLLEVGEHTKQIIP